MLAATQEALRRSSVVWVGLDGAAPRAVRHLWHDGALHVVSGAGGQVLAGAATATRADVVVRAAGSLSGAVEEVACAVERVAPGTAEWDAVAPLLAAGRHNGPAPAELVERWARDAVLLRLRPADRHPAG